MSKCICSKSASGPEDACPVHGDRVSAVLRMERSLSKLLVAAEGDDLLQVVQTIIEQRDELAEALRRMLPLFEAATFMTHARASGAQIVAADRARAALEAARKI